MHWLQFVTYKHLFSVAVEDEKVKKKPKLSTATEDEKRNITNTNTNIDTCLVWRIYRIYKCLWWCGVFHENKKKIKILYITFKPISVRSNKIDFDVVCFPTKPKRETQQQKYQNKIGLNSVEPFRFVDCTCIHIFCMLISKKSD